MYVGDDGDEKVRVIKTCWCLKGDVHVWRRHGLRCGRSIGWLENDKTSKPAKKQRHGTTDVANGIQAPFMRPIKSGVRTRESTYVQSGPRALRSMPCNNTTHKATGYWILATGDWRLAGAEMVLSEIPKQISQGCIVLKMTRIVGVGKSGTCRSLPGWGWMVDSNWPPRGPGRSMIAGCVRGVREGDDERRR